VTVLVWQWGRHGAGPRFAAALAESLGALPDMEVALSLSAQAEIMHGDAPPDCALPVPTYDGMSGFLARVATAPVLIGPLATRLRAMALRGAVCAMPAPLDFLMAAGLRRAGVGYAVVVHDAAAHDGEARRMEMALQRRLLRGASTLVALSQHVADQLQACGLARGKTLLLGCHPPFVFGPSPPPPRAHGGPLRLLCFGRLRPYKGLDLLAGALELLGARGDFVLRVVGAGAESAALRTLRRMPNVTVDNRWVPEAEVAELLAWSDAVLLPYREASQSGVAAAAIAAGRWLIATRVGGLAEQLEDGALGVLCEPSAQGIAEAVQTLLAHAPAPPRSPTDTRAAWQRLAEMMRPAIAATS
jgi:glycosyltransferase involved in cell wall biosynthesis